MDHYLAQINVARLIAPVDDPRIADFVAQLDSINAIAEQSPDFIWRLQSDSGNSTDIPYNEDPFIIPNMSVWKSLESLREFVYRTQHMQVFKDRAKWFEKMDKPHYCLWWIPAGHIPTLTEGRERLEHYQRHGATQYSFWFSKLYPQPEGDVISV